MMKHEEATQEMAEAIAKRIDIDLAFTIIPKKNGDLILAEIKTDKETRTQYCSTLAVYQYQIALANDFVSRCVSRALWGKKISDALSMRREYNRAADLVFAALVKVARPEVSNG